MRKRRVPVGKLVRGTKLRVLEHLESDSHGNQRVRVRCEWIVNGECCGVEKPMRVTDMTRKPYVVKNGKAKGKVVLPLRSCGCQSRRAHREFMERRANAIPAGVRRAIFLMVDGGGSFETVANRRNLDPDLVRTIYRVEVQALRPEVERWVAEHCPAGTKAGLLEWQQFLNDAKARLYALITRENRRARRRVRPRASWLQERTQWRTDDTEAQRKGSTKATAARFQCEPAGPDDDIPW